MKKKLTIAALAVILLTLVLSVVYVHKQITMETAHNGFTFAAATSPLFYGVLTALAIAMEAGIFVGIYHICVRKKQGRSAALPLILIVLCLLCLIVTVHLYFGSPIVNQILDKITLETGEPVYGRAKKIHYQYPVVTALALAAAVLMIVVIKKDKE